MTRPSVSSIPFARLLAAAQNGVVELPPFDFLERLADLVPPPRKHPPDRTRETGHAVHEPLISRKVVEKVPLTGLAFGRRSPP